MLGKPRTAARWTCQILAPVFNCFYLWANSLIILDLNFSSVKWLQKYLLVMLYELKNNIYINHLKHSGHFI